MRLLIIEDEATLRDQLVASLSEQQFAVDVAATGREGLYMGNEYPVDVAILDLGLPDMDGLEVLREWRAAGRTFPVLILTARDGWAQKVRGLELGADDYLAKPFHMAEVVARLRALVRRSRGVASAVLEAHGIRLDTGRQQVSLGDAAIELTAYEYRLLEHLMLHAGEVISKTELAEHLYNEDGDRDSNVLEVLVGRLRRKLDPEQVQQQIETLRGRGYRFRVDNDES